MKKEFELKLYVASDSNRQPVYTTEKSSPRHHVTLEQFIKDKLSLPSVEINHLNDLSFDYPGKKKNKTMKEREEIAKGFKITIETI